MSASFVLEPAVVSGRVRLSMLTPHALEQMSSWLPASLAPEWTLADLEQGLKRTTGVLISDADGVPIGLAVVQAGGSAPDCASVPLITVEPSRQFRGLGGEAGVALQRHLHASGFEKVYAPIPDGRGLAVYFWLRLGFRPLRTPESPGPVTGLTGESRAGIWMLRDSPAD